MKKFFPQKFTMYQPCSARNNQRTNLHSEALPSKKTGLPAPCPEMVRKKACTEDMNKTRARPRRPDMQLYVPRARRSQVASGTSLSLDIHSSERVQSSQIDSNCSDVSLELIQNCSSSVPNVGQNKCDGKRHMLQSNIEHQEDQPETENLNENDDPDFNRSCDNVKNVKLSASQFIQNCSKSILYTKNSVEEKRNILNVHDCEKIILNQNSPILSRKAHIANLCKDVPDFDCTELANQRERNDITEHSHSSLHISDNEFKSDVCNSTECLDSALMEIKLDGLSESKDLCVKKEFSSEKSDTQPELIETQGLRSDILNEDIEHFQASCNVVGLRELEFAAEQKESIFLNKEKQSADIDTDSSTTQCEDYFPESKTSTTQYEEKNSDVKMSEVLLSLLETSKDADTSLESTETEATLDSSDTANGSSKSANDDSWDSMFDDSGECLNPDILKELTTAVGNVKITKSKYNYFEFQPHEPDVSGEEFGHIVEFYDFPAEFKNQDLLTIISAFKSEAFNIKWVDDTHALGVFSSPIAAMGALSLNHPLLKVRPLSQGIRESKFKAKRCAEFLQPYRPRPETSATIARRLVSGALGVRVQIPKEQRELERKRLKEARDKRRQAAKQKQDIWDGVVS